MINFKYLIAGPFIAAAALAATAAPAQAPALNGIVSTITPGVVGNTVQAGVGNTRVGAPTGLIGNKGTPTTVVGVAVATPNYPPQGSVASVAVANGQTPLSVTTHLPR